MADKKEFERILREIEKQGFRVERGTKHMKIWPPNKAMPMITAPTSPGGGRGLANLKAQLRRSGAIL
jgi:hypothetical protein